MSMTLGTFEQMENNWSTLLKRWKKTGRHFWTDGKHLVGTFDEYGADGQGEEGGVSDNKAANISHLPHLFIYCVVVSFLPVKVFVNNNTFETYLWQPAVACPLIMWWCHSRYVSYSSPWTLPTPSSYYGESSSRQSRQGAGGDREKGNTGRLHLGHACSTTLVQNMNIPSCFWHQELRGARGQRCTVVRPTHVKHPCGPAPRNAVGQNREAVVGKIKVTLSDLSNSGKP